MKRVTALAILGTPAFVWQANVCPACGGKCNVYADGSVLCIAENQYFEPEPSDKFLAAMRRGFDSENGITTADRLLNPLVSTSPLVPPLDSRRPTGVHA